MVFVLISLKHFDPILGYSEAVLSSYKAFNCSEIRVFLRLLDDWIVLEGFDVVH